MPLIHKRLINVRRMAGYATRNVKTGETVELLCRSFITSDDDVFFYKFINSLTNTYFVKTGISEPFVSNFLILHHDDLSVDIYLNDLPIVVEFLSKRSVNKGENVSEKDIADIKRLRFHEIEIKETDHIFFCFKYGWRFGYYFDCACGTKSTYKIDLDKMYLDFGSYFKKLVYHYLFKVISNSAQFLEMQNDGWFPYLEILGTDYKKLSEAYENKFNVQEVNETLINSFDKARITRITSKWWSNPLYAEKRKLLEAGINSYLRENEDGFIASIKILFSEIEGILSYLLLKDTKSYIPKSNQLIAHLKEIGAQRTGSTDPLFFPGFFSDFLKSYLFPQFDLIKNNIGLSRHTSGHGIAKPESYTKIKALHAILILNQIYFFIPPNK